MHLSALTLSSLIFFANHGSFSCRDIEKDHKADFSGWLVAGWSISFSALIVLTHYRSPILIRKIVLSS